MWVTEYALGRRSGTVLPPRVTGLQARLTCRSGCQATSTSGPSGQALPAGRAECLCWNNLAAVLALDAVYVRRQLPGHIGLPTELYYFAILHTSVKMSTDICSARCPESRLSRDTN